MNKNWLGICIFAGLLSIACALPLAVRNYTSASHTVTVRGLCEMEVKADRVIWPIAFKEGGNDLVELAARTEAKNRLVTDWLLSEGISKDQISVSAPKVENQKANGYVGRSYDYIMTSVITVCTSDVDKVVALESKQFGLLNKGVAIGANEWDNHTVYEYTALNSIKPEMIEKATCNAREAADKFAKDSGSRVGEIVTATQGQFSINDRDSNTPYMKVVRVVTTVVYQLK